MNAPTRLGLYGAVLVAVFAVAFVAANTVISEETVQNWVDETDDHAGGHDVDDDQYGDEGDSQSGPAPTPGRYLLYLDFQVDGQVHTAELVLDAGTAGDGAPAPADDDDQVEGDDHGHE